MYLSSISPKKKLLALALVGAFAFSVPVTSEAARKHDPKVESKVETQQHKNTGKSMNVTEKGKKQLPEMGKKDSLEDRINAILHPKTPEVPAMQVPMTVSAFDSSIIGTPMASQEQCVKYLLSVNPHPSISVTPQQLVAYYYEEGMREGIRPDVAFAQALKETGFFRYGGTVTPDQNNYCGLGTTSAHVKGAYFTSSQMGVRAHIQHLLAYASTRKPAERVVDPRYEIVRGVYGSKTLGKWEDLNGRWAVPGHSYGQSILSMFRAMLQS